MSAQKPVRTPSRNVDVVAAVDEEGRTYKEVRLSRV